MLTLAASKLSSCRHHSVVNWNVLKYVMVYRWVRSVWWTWPAVREQTVLEREELDSRKEQTSINLSQRSAKSSQHSPNLWVYVNMTHTALQCHDLLTRVTYERQKFTCKRNYDTLVFAVFYTSDVIVNVKSVFKTVVLFKHNYINWMCVCSCALQELRCQGMSVSMSVCVCLSVCVCHCKSLC